MFRFLSAVDERIILSPDNSSSFIWKEDFISTFFERNLLAGKFMLEVIPPYISNGEKMVKSSFISCSTCLIAS